MEEMVDCGDPIFEEKVGMLLDMFDVDSLARGRKIKASIYGSRSHNWLSRLLRRRRLVLYPVAFKGQFTGIADPVVISIHGGIRPFVWLTRDKQLVIRSEKRFYRVLVYELAQALEPDQRERLIVSLQRNSDELRILYAEDYEKFYSEVIKELG